MRGLFWFIMSGNSVPGWLSPMEEGDGIRAGQRKTAHPRVVQEHTEKEKPGKKKYPLPATTPVSLPFWAGPASKCEAFGAHFGSNPWYSVPVLQKTQAHPTVKNALSPSLNPTKVLKVPALLKSLSLKSPENLGKLCCKMLKIKKKKKKS